jgi:hypothetical protein
MSNRETDQPGAPRRGEQQQGDKTHEAFIESLEGVDQANDSTHLTSRGTPARPDIAGHHRLAEDRQQHDEAEKNSEKNRLARERDRSGSEPG